MALVQFTKGEYYNITGQHNLVETLQYNATVGNTAHFWEWLSQDIRRDRTFTLYELVALCDYGKCVHYPMVNIEDIPNLSGRTYACLKRNRIDKVADIRNMSYGEITTLKNIGRKTVEELENRLGIQFIIKLAR